MELRAVARSNGLVLMASVLGTIVLLVLGLGITSWFSAEQGVLLIGARGDFGHSTASISPATVEICSYERCVSAWTLQLADGVFPKLAGIALLVGAAFGALVLWFATRRIASAEVPLLLKLLGFALALAAVALALLCMFVHKPGVVAYEILQEGVNPYALWPAQYTRAITKPPVLGPGGFLTIIGVLLGSFVIWGARSPARAEAPEPRRRRRRDRSEPRPDARSRSQHGPETDPFRSPPRPHIAVVRHERPATTPVDADPTQDPPKLLR